MGKQIEYKDYFTVAEYYSLVNEIVDSYFDEAGNYAPHIGDMCTMLAFYNGCIMNKNLISDMEVITDIFDADVIFANEEFLEAFNEAITFDGDIKYDFANAFKNAMEIIHSRINSPTYAISQATRQIGELVSNLDNMISSVNNVMNEETVDKLLEFAKNVSDGKYDAKAVTDAFTESEAFKAIMAKGE